MLEVVPNNEKMLKSKSQIPSQRRLRQPVEGVFCNYSHRTCMHNRLDAYDYCIRHILEDKNAPFKQCAFISSKNGKRCLNAAPKADRKDGYCAEHSRRAVLLRQRSTRKPQPKETAESLLEDLDHFKGVQDNRRIKGYSDSVASKVLEYASSEDSDLEPPLVDQAWRGDGDSDPESVDSDQEDLLKHAGVYTAEEVALVMRDKLIRLQSLYIDQFKRLQHIMKEKRRKYLHTHKQEKETLGSLSVYKEGPETRDKYSKLKALKRYHKRHGKEALLHRQSKQRRIAVSEGANYRPPSYPKCVHVEDGNKCLHRALPLSKYCSQHILTDQYQVLYRPCQFGGGRCGQPVVTLEDTARCPLHTSLKEMDTRFPLKPEETDDELDLDEAELLSKDILLPHLDALQARDAMAQHLLSKNPELPESIFSGSEPDDHPMSSYMQDSLQNLMPSKHSIDSDLGIKNQLDQQQSSSNMSSASSSSSPSPWSDETKEDKKVAYGPLLLQHLQGKVDLANINNRPRTSLPATSPRQTTTSAMATTPESMITSEVSVSTPLSTTSSTLTASSSENHNGNELSQNGDSMDI
ncbi:KAT8 regulatory NSL complex subunit 2-like isoform X2 [Mizuhopecten yessoensis]|uniref:KAT8 regulatory NSL complex subunit 2 n=1 Tax=Mizuhopecten yessoensis TaxID=6573 RepID=A0A210PFV7_MIZYE|nr:KAT8 regulatory NSL complex subunit 2-like isoform X2 [Mizuhopecten yessoensis]OWF35336.1 KAT8 regulatory NSL complex subunit 2 [Mizuhopecten yessoensis]